MRRYAVFLIILVSLAVPFAGAGVPSGIQEAGPIITGRDLNGTGADIANQTAPSRYGITPSLIHVDITVSDTSLPAMKGEMAQGPRSIDPAALLLLVGAIIAASAGMWYLTKRKPQEPEGEDEENRE